MGQLTRSTIVARGLLRAGDSNLTVRANEALNEWLRSVYKSMEWPFLYRELTALALGTGVQTLQVGAGSGGVTEDVARINDPIYVYKSDYTSRGIVRVRSLTGDALNSDETINDPAVNRSMPTSVKVRPNASYGNWGRWDLVFNCAADKDYLLKVPYFFIPADIDTSASGDGTKPIYPNDRTLVQAVVAFATKFKKFEDWEAEQQILAELVQGDRAQLGEIPGFPDVLGLDPRVFR